MIACTQPTQHPKHISLKFSHSLRKHNCALIYLKYQEKAANGAKFWMMTAFASSALKLLRIARYAQQPISV